MPKKPKTQNETLTLDSVVRMSGEVVMLRAEIQKHDALRKTAKALADEKYEASVKPLKTKLESLFVAVETWATINKSRFLTPRSWPLARAVIGWRMSNHEVKPRYKITLAAAAERIAGMPKSFAKYLRPRDPEINKESILEDRDLLTDEQLQAMGLRIVQQDRFYIEAPKDDQDC